MCCLWLLEWIICLSPQKLVTTRITQWPSSLVKLRARSGLEKVRPPQQRPRTYASAMQRGMYNQHADAYWPYAQTNGTSWMCIYMCIYYTVYYMYCMYSKLLEARVFIYFFARASRGVAQNETTFTSQRSKSLDTLWPASARRSGAPAEALAMDGNERLLCPRYPRKKYHTV